MTRCAAHLEDLKIEEMMKLPVFKKPFARAKSTSQFILNRPLLLHEVSKHSDVRPLKFGQTRFAINLLVALRLLDIEGACRQLIASGTWESWYRTQKPSGKRAADKFRRRVGRDQFWDSLRLICPVFIPIICLLRSVDSQRSGLAGQYMVRLQKQEEEVMTAAAHFTDDVKATVLAMLRRRRKESHSRLYSVAFMLDPTNRGCDEAVAIGDEWVPVVHDDWNDYVHSLPVGDRQEVLSGFTAFQLSNESFGHPLAVESASCTPPHLWWDRHGYRAPKLQRLARRLLSVTLSASACERNWSLWSFVLSKRRLSMLPERAKKVVACISNRISIDVHCDPGRVVDRDPWAPPEDDDDGAIIGGLVGAVSDGLTDSEDSVDEDEHDNDNGCDCSGEGDDQGGRE
eukprot:GHVU01072865.1.p1 GENE.GHVU01072865.1~~GHVU01072865.1.p1  ORF type:complete len:400 (-),score=50.93 GHVU01072865.1:444-1643(-)